MSLDIFFSADIRSAILAANEASSATAEAALSQDTRIIDQLVREIWVELHGDGVTKAKLEIVHQAALSNVDILKHYRKGYRAALVTLALAFGLSPAIVDGGRPLERLP